MRVAIVGSRTAPDNILQLIMAHLPQHTSEIVSGGASGVDTAAAHIAKALSLPLTVFTPSYTEYGKAAPLLRNEQIVAYADEVLAFWDAQSTGTRQVIAACIKSGKPVHVIPLK